MASEGAGSDVLTVPEAAALLRVSTDTLYAAVGRGEVPHRRVGRRILFSRQALNRWLGHPEGPLQNA